jgi:hypothetical protein
MEQDRVAAFVRRQRCSCGTESTVRRLNGPHLQLGGSRWGLLLLAPPVPCQVGQHSVLSAPCVPSPHTRSTEPSCSDGGRRRRRILFQRFLPLADVDGNRVPVRAWGAQEVTGSDRHAVSVSRSSSSNFLLGAKEIQGNDASVTR